MSNREEFRAATTRGRKIRASVPAAIAARYDKRAGRIVVSLATGLDISFSPRTTQGLESAKSGDLKKIEISPSGLGLYFPALDADIYLPALLDGYLGSKNWMAAHLGARGGKAKSAARTAALRANGKLGGRSRKTAA